LTDRSRLRFQLLGTTVPACVQSLQQDILCGRSFAKGALMIDELP
jgi:hypothetical protein